MWVKVSALQTKTLFGLAVPRSGGEREWGIAGSYQVCLLLSPVCVPPWILSIVKMVVQPQHVNSFFLFHLIQNLGKEESPHPIFWNLYCHQSAGWHLHESKLTSLWRMEPAGIILNKKPSGWHRSLKWVKTKVIVGFD